jgi:hypothetical protein
VQTLLTVLNRVFSGNTNIEQVEENSQKLLEQNVDEITINLSTNNLPTNEKEYAEFLKRVYESERQFLLTYRKKLTTPQQTFRFGGE